MKKMKQSNNSIIKYQRSIKLKHNKINKAKLNVENMLWLLRKLIEFIQHKSIISQGV